MLNYQRVMTSNPRVKGIMVRIRHALFSFADSNARTFQLCRSVHDYDSTRECTNVPSYNMYTIKISLSPSYFQGIPIWAVAAKLWLVDDWFRDFMNQYFMGIWQSMNGESRSQPTSAKERHKVGFRTLLNHGKLNHKMASQNWVQTFGIRWWTWKSFGSMYDLADRLHCVS